MQRDDRDVDRPPPQPLTVERLNRLLARYNRALSAEREHIKQGKPTSSEGFWDRVLTDDEQET